ncbi:MAG: Holliday junction resolvase RuvX [Phycisphaerales bacterium]
MTTRRPMRYLAVDLGGKRTGLAVGDDLTRIASPVDVLEIPPGPRLVEAILRAIAEHGPDALVIGLPLNMDGSEGEAAKQVRAFGDLLAKAASLPIEFHDERLTSRAAELDLAGLYTRKGKKRRLDAVAAARILSGYLARERG